jgi:hypothetical protein
MAGMSLYKYPPGCKPVLRMLSNRVSCVARNQARRMPTCRIALSMKLPRAISDALETLA